MLGGGFGGGVRGGGRGFVTVSESSLEGFFRVDPFFLDGLIDVGSYPVGGDPLVDFVSDVGALRKHVPYQSCGGHRPGACTRRVLQLGGQLLACSVGA